MFSGFVESPMGEDETKLGGTTSSTPFSISAPSTPESNISREQEETKDRMSETRTNITELQTKGLPPMDKFHLSPHCTICSSNDSSFPCRELATKSQMGALLQIFPAFPPYILELALADSKGNVSQAVDRILSLMKYYSGYGKASEKITPTNTLSNDTTTLLNDPYSFGASIRYCSRCGHKVFLSDNFCSACGNTLKKY